MTNIIKLARQAGGTPYTNRHYPGETAMAFGPVALERFVELIRADERAALDAPEPTVPDNMQDWKGMDGTIAWHLIERHADNWADIGKMMGEWLAANQTVLDVPEREPLSDARIDEIMKPLTQNVPYSWREFARAIEQEVSGK